MGWATVVRRFGMRWSHEMKSDPLGGCSPGVAAAIDYCKAVLSGRISACRLVQLTCARFLGFVDK